MAQIIVLTMPAASHLAIHFRDDRRREADPASRRPTTLARRRRRRSSGRAVTGAIGYGALVTSDVVPIQQFGAILGVCTLMRGAPRDGHLADRHAAPVPARDPRPRRLDAPGSRAAMNRLTVWVVRHPAAIVAAVARRGRCRSSLGMFRLRYETNYINLFRPETRVVQRLPRRRVEARRDRPGRARRARRARRSTPATLGRAPASSSGRSPRSASDGPARDRPGPLAGHGARPRRPARGPPRRAAGAHPGEQARPDRRSRRRPSCSTASGTPRPGEARILVRLLEQQPAPTKTRDLPRGRGRGPRRRSARRLTSPACRT